MLHNYSCTVRSTVPLTLFTTHYDAPASVFASHTHMTMRLTMTKSMIEMFYVKNFNIAPNALVVWKVSSTVTAGAFYVKFFNIVMRK